MRSSALPRRRILGRVTPVVGTLALLAGAPPAAAGPGVHMWQTKDANVTEGYVDVEATPAELYDALTAYAHWPELLTDIQWSKHKSGGREDAVVQCKSRTFGGAQHYKFRNARNQSIHYTLTDGPGGVTLWWHATFERLGPGNGNDGLTRVRIRMHISVGGVLGWLTSDKKVRKYRERKLRRDLFDIGRKFAPRPRQIPVGG